MKTIEPTNPGLSRAETAGLVHAYRTQGDCAARERLIEAYLPLARSVARRFAHRGERVEDLVQVGSIGLINAVDRFDPGRGVDLATFAAPNIVGEIKRHLRDRAALIRVPRREQEANARLRVARRQLSRRLQRAPTRAELKAAAELDENDFAEASRVEDARALLTITDAAHVADAGDAFRVSEDRVVLARGMRTLHRRERQVVRCRYFADMSQDEIAQRLGISQTHASRLLASGLSKLRENLGGNGDFSGSRELNSAHGDSRRRQKRTARSPCNETATADRQLQRTALAADAAQPA